MAQIQSGASADLLIIDPVSKAARATLYGAGGEPIVFDAGDQPTTPTGLLSMGLNDNMVLPMRLDRFGSQAQASHMPLFIDQFEGTTLNGNRWTSVSTTMTATQTTVAGLQFNGASITTVSTGYMLKSNRAFLRSLRQPLHGKFRARLWHFNNSVMELGFGDAATFNGANATGAYWQVTAAGVVQPVLTFNGVDTTGSDVRGLLDLTNHYTFDIFMDDDEVTYMIQDTSTGLVVSKQSIKLPATAQTLLSTTQIGVLARLYNTAVAPATASVMNLTSVYVAMLDGITNASQPHIMAMMLRGGEAQPHTGAQLAQWSNSAAPANATLSNTAAGYTTLGGLFSFAAVAGAATDYALFGVQIPAPATFVCTGVQIDAWNTGAAVATTPTVLAWALAVNATAVSLATSSTIRVPLGAQALPVGAAIGAMADRTISRTFESPMAVGPGRWLHVLLRMPVGTATASQVIQGMVSVNGYFI